jgi:hypothetical protein
MWCALATLGRAIASAFSRALIGFRSFGKAAMASVLLTWINAGPASRANAATKEEEHMSDSRVRAAPWPTINGLRQWWRSWREAKSGLSDLNSFGDYEVERTARELGTSVSELRVLTARGPESANLLLGRMAALDLDPKEVAATDLATFRDLQRVCTMCGSHGRCARELARDPNDTAWEDYCPNVATLKSLDALPWKGRGEW